MNEHEAQPFHLVPGIVITRNMAEPRNDDEDFNSAIWPGRSFEVMDIWDGGMVILKLLPWPGSPGTMTMPERLTTITERWFIPD